MRATKTFLPKTVSVERRWYVIDGTDQVVGRLASRIATVLMGKHKPVYTDFLDTGDFVIVVNAEKVRFTGSKWDEKMYRRHSGRPGGLREITARQVLAKHPERLLMHAVKGMLPKNKLGKRMLKRLRVYAGGAHPHQAQQPQPLPF